MPKFPPSLTQKDLVEMRAWVGMVNLAPFDVCYGCLVRDLLHHPHDNLHTSPRAAIPGRAVGSGLALPNTQHDGLHAHYLEVKGQYYKHFGAMEGLSSI